MIYKDLAKDTKFKLLNSDNAYWGLDNIFMKIDEFFAIHLTSGGKLYMLDNDPVEIYS